MKRMKKMSKSILQDEKWKDVQGYEGMYQVSNRGRVKSLGQTSEYVTRWGTIAYRNYPPKIMRATDNGHGYLFVQLRKDGHRKNHYVHRLVADAFIGDIGDLEINHKDYDKRNNNVTNLEIIDRKGNVNYSLQHMKKPHKQHTITNTGEKYITKTKDRGMFRVNIKQFGIDKRYHTLEEAVAKRNEVLNREQEYFAR
jgi:hypothetical protein